MSLKVTDPHKVRKEKAQPVHSVKLHPLIKEQMPDPDMRRVEIVREEDGLAVEVILHNNRIR